MRTFSALVVATGLVVSLAACSSSDELSSCAPAVAEGEASKLIEAPGDGEPKVSFPTPLIGDELQRSFTRVGSGEVLEAGDIASTQVVQLNGADGALGASTWSTDQPGLSPVGKDEGPLGELLACTPIGSRIVAVVPASIVSETAAEGDTIVVAIDVLDGFEGKAEGTPQLPLNDLPAISIAPDGQPGFSFPNSDAPAKLTASVLQRGDGEVVEGGDTVVLHFSALKWSDRSTYSSTWDAGRPLGAVIDDQDTLQQEERLYLPAAAKAELDGLPVGSQVIVSVPAEDAPQSGLTEGETLVYVIDILAIS